MATYIYKNKSLIPLTPTEEYIIKQIETRVPVKFTYDEKNSYAQAAKLMHEHDNKDILDKITYDTATGGLLFNGGSLAPNSLTKGQVEDVIDEKVPVKISEQEKKNYDNAYKISHIHDNEEVIDKFSYDLGTNRLMYDNTPLTGSGLMYSEVVNLIDEKVPVKISADEKASYDDAASYAHQHLNMLILNSIGFNKETQCFTYEDRDITGASGLTEMEVSNIIDKAVPIRITPEKEDDVTQTLSQSHYHNNKSILDMFSCDGTSLKFNGETIYTLSSPVTVIDEPMLDSVANATASPDTESIILTWEDPENVSINGRTVNWAGTKVLMKIGTYPENDSDGILVVDNTTKNKYKTDGLLISSLSSDMTYCFKLFVYSDTNKTSVNVARLNCVPLKSEESDTESEQSYEEGEE